MPSWVLPQSDPTRKRLRLEKRIRRLRSAVKARECLTNVAHEAESVRRAALALIKAKQALIRKYPQRDPDGRQSWNLQDEEQQWLFASAEMIVAEHGRDEANLAGHRERE
jgi:hypothetical protein